MFLLQFFMHTPVVPRAGSAEEVAAEDTGMAVNILAAVSNVLSAHVPKSSNYKVYIHLHTQQSRVCMH